MNKLLYGRIFPRWRPRDELRPRTSSASGASLLVRWLGTAAHVIESETTRIAIDPFVTRPGLRHVAAAHLAPNEHEVFERFGAVTGQQLGDGQNGPTGQSFQQLSSILILGSQQRAAVQIEQIERPVLDAGRTATVLHFVEGGYTGLVESDDLAIEHRVMVCEIACQ